MKSNSVSVIGGGSGRLHTTIPGNCSVCIRLYVMHEVDVLVLLALLCFCWRWAFFVKEVFVNVVRNTAVFSFDGMTILSFYWGIQIANTFVANETICPTLVVLLFLCTLVKVLSVDDGNGDNQTQFVRCLNIFCSVLCK